MESSTEFWANEFDAKCKELDVNREYLISVMQSFQNEPYGFEQRRRNRYRRKMQLKNGKYIS